MKNCIYCDAEFLPASNRQKVCRDTICRKKLHAERIQRYRNKKREQTNEIKINKIIKENNWINFSDISKIAKLKDSTLSYNIQKLAKQGKIDQVHSRYKDLTLNQNNYIILLGDYQIELRPYFNVKSMFLNYLQDEGISIDNYGIGKKINNKNYKKLIEISCRAYACIWAYLLSIRIYDQFYIENRRGVTKAEDAISFFLHEFNGKFKGALLPKKQQHYYGPVFTQIVTVEYIKNGIKNSKDMSDFLKQIYNGNKEQIYNNKNYEYLNKFLNNLLKFSNNNFFCRRLYLALKKTIDYHGEPYIKIKKSTSSM